MVKTCVITGAGSGIGKAAAFRLAECGTRLLLVGRQRSLEITAKEIRQQYPEALVELAFLDLSDYLFVQKTVTALLQNERAGSLGLILAAAHLGKPKDLTKMDLAETNRTWEVNVLGNLAVLGACLTHRQNFSVLRAIFFAGGGAAYAYPLFNAYALSKVAVVRLVENLGAEYPATSGICVTCLAPGAVATRMLEKVIQGGGTVKTCTDIQEPVEFIEAFLASKDCQLHGRYVHVRDSWREVLNGTKQLGPEQWTLRRSN